MNLNQGQGPTNAAAAALSPTPTPVPATPIVNTQGSGVPISPSSRLGPALTQ